jgi:hypothetical protein
MTPELALRATVWLSVLAWAASEVLRRSAGDRHDAARASYTAGIVLMVAHTAAAFQFRHGWSHAAALADTAVRSEAIAGFASGAGLYLNYLFIAVWAGDALWWWLNPGQYRRRSRGLDSAVFLFFLFMFANGAVVFAAGPMRLAGAAAIAVVIAARLAWPARQTSVGRV